MTTSPLTIRDREFALPEADLTGDHAVMDGQHLLLFSLHAVTDPEDAEPRAGVAINCIVVQGLPSLRDLDGRTISIVDGQADPMNNELSESVIVESGETLELQRLVLRFGEVTGDQVEVKLEAVCFNPTGNPEERSIGVYGRLWARIGRCRERLVL